MTCTCSLTCCICWPCCLSCFSSLSASFLSLRLLRLSLLSSSLPDLLFVSGELICAAESVEVAVADCACCECGEWAVSGAVCGRLSGCCLALLERTLVAEVAVEAAVGAAVVAVMAVRHPHCYYRYCRCQTDTAGQQDG